MTGKAWTDVHVAGNKVVCESKWCHQSHLSQLTANKERYGSAYIKWRARWRTRINIYDMNSQSHKYLMWECRTPSIKLIRPKPLSFQHTLNSQSLLLFSYLRPIYCYSSGLQRRSCTVTFRKDIKNIASLFATFSTSFDITMSRNYRAVQIVLMTFCYFSMSKGSST